MRRFSSLRSPGAGRRYPGPHHTNNTEKNIHPKKQQGRQKSGKNTEETLGQTYCSEQDPDRAIVVISNLR